MPDHARVFALCPRVLPGIREDIARAVRSGVRAGGTAGDPPCLR